MNKRPSHSLSRKIVYSIAVISLTIMGTIFLLFEKTNREAFSEIEKEKAQLIADTVEPLLALNLYLGLDDRVSQLVRQLIDNPDIIAVTITKEDKNIQQAAKLAGENGEKDSFVITKAILQPNSPKQIGVLELAYSNENYNALVDKYTDMLLLLLVLLWGIFLLFSLYVKKLFFPLKQIASLLKNYSPEQEAAFPYAKENNEIGLISSALNDMQLKILEYGNAQKDINRILEKKVGEKTRELRHQLYSDSLTKLPNRIQIVEDINGLNDGALVIINIDDFKEINDFFGHLSGDTLLIDFAKRLAEIVSRYETGRLYRLSGDEFAMIVDRKMTQSALEHWISGIVNEVENMHFIIEESSLNIRVTAGATLQNVAALEKADIALKAARKERKSFLVYNENLKIEQQYKTNMEWVKKLRNAIKSDMIVPYYQPVYDKKGRVASYECLIRIVEETGDVVTPQYFLDIAKKSRLYTKLTKIVIEKSCRYFADVDMNFSINLSVDDIINPEVVRFIKETVTRYGVSEKIIFEILESEGIENYKEVSVFINEMKDIGCHIAIDDFGSGYSNFEHFLRLDVDYIKIDGSLIRNIDTDPNALIVVETIVDFARRLHIWTVAEYVHNPKVYETVKSIGVDRFQGYYLGEPRRETSQKSIVK